MPPKKAPPQPRGPEWLEATSARIHVYKEEAAALTSAAPAAGAGASSSSSAAGGGRAEPSAARSAPGGGSSRRVGPTYGLLPPTTLPESPAAESAFLRYSQATALGFDPARRAVMIAGRPVVVSQRP